MAKRPETVSVDEADVQRVADAILTLPDPKVSDEKLVELATKIAGHYAVNNTAAWRRELVRKVRRKVDFALIARRTKPR